MDRRGGLLLSLTALLIVGCGSSASSSNSSSNGGTGGGNPPPAITVSVTPRGASVIVNQQLTFQATVTGLANTAVTWEVSGVVGGNSTAGIITAAGVYTAPMHVPTPANVTVTAVSQASPSASGSASVVVAASNANQRAQQVPIELGTSGGNANDTSTQGKLTYCCGGTLGSLLQLNGNYYILSNNHILARSDSGQVGDPITQPGLTDTNCSTSGTTQVGILQAYPHLQSAGNNVDAAVALVVSGTVDTSGNVLSLGATATSGTPDPGAPQAGTGIVASLGETVAKSGRTSGLTCSTVDVIDVATSVSYQTGCNTGTTFSVNYHGQVSVAGGNFSSSGDSGSLIVDQSTAAPIALLYGGSDTDTVGNPVSDVLSALGSTLGGQPTFVGSTSSHVVIGCMVTAPAVQAAPAAAVALSETQLAAAQRARDMHAPELLSNPYIQAIGVGPSVDHPGEASVVVVVNPGQIPSPLPDQLDGIATRIVQASPSNNPHGVFEADAAQRIAPVVNTFAVQGLSSQELARAKAVHTAHVAEWMKQPGVQGVGITSSADAPGEAALMIFVVRGVARNPIPPTIDGLRTRIRESSRFTAGQRGTQASTGCQVPLTPILPKP